MSPSTDPTSASSPTPADETLAAKHSATSTKNISRFLLDQVGLDEKQVRKNARNETHMLSFRDLTRLCLIGEREMQAEEALASAATQSTRPRKSRLSSSFLREKTTLR